MFSNRKRLLAIVAAASIVVAGILFLFLYLPHNDNDTAPSASIRNYPNNETDNDLVDTKRLDDSINDSQIEVLQNNDITVQNNDITFRTILDELINDGQIEVLQNDDMTVRAIVGDFIDIEVHNPEDALRVFMQIAPAYLPPSVEPESINLDINDIEVIATDADTEVVYYRLYPSIDGISVFGSEMILVVDGGKQPQGFFSAYNYKINTVDTVPTVSSTDVEATVLYAISDVISDFDSVLYNLSDFLVINSRLIIDSIDSDKDPVLAWLVTVYNKYIFDDDDDDDYDDDEHYMPELTEIEGAYIPLISISYYIYANGENVGEIYVEQESINNWENDIGEATDSRGVTRELNVQYQSRWWPFSDRWQLHDGVRNISTHNANGRPRLGRIIRNTHSANSWEKRAVSAHSNVAEAYDFFSEVLRHESYDNKGSELRSTTMYTGKRGEVQNNAQWVTITDEWGYIRFFNGHHFEAALDVVGHEYTHGVINSIVGGLGDLSTTLGMWVCGCKNDDCKRKHNEYYREASSLNEAYADILGMLIESNYREYAKDNERRWTLGEDIANEDGAVGLKLRDMSNPASIDCPHGMPYPDHYSKLDSCNDCADGPHFNSNIFSHAVYKMMTDPRTDDIFDKDWAWVFYESLRTLKVNDSFIDARVAVINAALLWGFYETDEIKAVEEAFCDVGICPQIAACVYCEYKTNYDFVSIQSQFAGRETVIRTVLDYGQVTYIAVKTDGKVVINPPLGTKNPYTGGFAGGYYSTWSDIVAVTTAFRHIFGLRADGTVVVNFQKRGIGGYAGARGVWFDDETAINVSDWDGIVAISGGRSVVFGLRYDGTVLSAFSTAFGGSNPPSVSDWRDIVAISACHWRGHAVVVGLRSDGTVVASDHWLAEAVSSWHDIAVISSGEYGVIGLRSDGTVVAVSSERRLVDVSSWNEIVAISANSAVVYEEFVGLQSNGLRRSYDGNNTSNDEYLNEQYYEHWPDVVAIVDSNTYLKSDGTIFSIRTGSYLKEVLLSFYDIRLP